jgi:hypothetical protein
MEFLFKASKRSMERSTSKLFQPLTFTNHEIYSGHMVPTLLFAGTTVTTPHPAQGTIVGTKRPSNE